MTDTTDSRIRIWHQSFTVLDDLPAYRDLLAAHLARSSRPDVQIDLHGMAQGTYPSNYPGTHIRYVGMQHLHKEQFIRAALTAEDEGYDAFLIASIPDPAYEEVRTLVDIPVIAFGQASLAVASTLGNPVGVVNFIDELGAQIRRNAQMYGFGELIGPVVSLERPFNDILEAYDDPAPLLEAFHSAARRCIEAGANVIVPGEGPLNLLLAHHGVHRVDDVPVLDSLATTVKVCEARVDLHRSGSLRPSRRGYFYDSPPRELVAEALQFYRPAADQPSERLL